MWMQHDIRPPNQSVPGRYQDGEAVIVDGVNLIYYETTQLSHPRETVCVNPNRHHPSPTSPASGRTGSSTFSYPNASPSQLSTSSPSSGGAHSLWNSAGVSGDRSEFSGKASNIDLDATQIRYLTYNATELRTFQYEKNAALGARSEHAHRYPKQRLKRIGSILDSGWQSYSRIVRRYSRSRQAAVVVGCRRQPRMPDEEDHMPDNKDSPRSRRGDGIPVDKDSSRSGVGDGEGEGDVVGDGDGREDEEEDSEDIFDADEGAIIGDR
ncbi:hypothetical protein V8E53_007508 [Lactarius tabidus]